MKTCLLVISLFIGSVCVAQKNSGIYYTTIFAKQGAYMRLAGFGLNASNFFLKDVNNDGKDDAVAYYNNGDWYVAISNGTHFLGPKKFLSYSVSSSVISLMGDVNGDGKQDAVYFNPSTGAWHAGLSKDTAFATPVQWTLGNGVGSTNQFLEDVNGDGKDDAVFYFHTGLPGYWYVGLSNGTTGFGGFSAWVTGYGTASDQRFLGDMNGDGKADAVTFTKSTGSWNVALSSGSAFGSNSTWKTNFGNSKEKGFVYDVDRDGYADVAYYDSGEWWACYSTGTGLGSYNHRWVINNRPANSRGNLPAPAAKLLGSMSGSITEACAVSNLQWLCLGNNNKSVTADAIQVDTWTAWGSDYEPQVPGHTGTYDAGDSTINDIQLKMIHDAGFTYIMFDLTNGVNPWIDNRAKQFVQRIKRWNANLQTGQHKMYFCISVGGSRAATTTEAAMQAIEAESQWIYNDFYVPDSSAYYKLNGKPLLVHFVQLPANSTAIKNYSGPTPRPNYNKFTIRWMYNAIYNDTIYSNAYGWPIYNKYGNPPGTEVMDVMPGFWNGSSGSVRDQGDLYRSQWMRVLQYNPASVWLNSFNESWEHTAVEPSYIAATNTMDNPSMDSTWTDYYGDRMDDFYWVMTKQYNRLFMYNELFLNSYIQEYGDANVYKVTACSFTYQGSMPHMAPILLVPAGFRSSFNGNIINNDLSTVCSGGVLVSSAGDNPATAEPGKALQDETILDVKAAPNPSPRYFTLIIKSGSTQPVNIAITDITGKLIEVKTNMPANGNVDIGHTYQPGTYFAKVKQGSKQVIVKLVRVN